MKLSDKVIESMAEAMWHEDAKRCGTKRYVLWSEAGLGDHEKFRGFALVAEKAQSRDWQAMLIVCEEILEIQKEYDTQNQKGYVDSPGGLEHMGDVWTQIAVWAGTIRAALEKEPTP